MTVTATTNGEIIGTSFPGEEELIAQAASDKATLIEVMGAKMMRLGMELSVTAFEYYQAVPNPRATLKEPEAILLKAKKAALETQYDAVKHYVSALQSALRFEREQDGN